MNRASHDSCPARVLDGSSGEAKAAAGIPPSRAPGLSRSCLLGFQREGRRTLGTVAAFATMALFAHCGYHLQGTGGALPSTVKVVAVLPFERQVPVLQLDQRVTEAVTREFAQRVRVKVQSSKDGADAILSGTITGYGVTPLSYDSAGRANRYQVTMSAMVTLADRDGKVLFESQGYRFTEVYERSSNPAGYISAEVVAYDVVARDFARALVSTMMEAGPGPK